jgi:hypothetical protein
VTVVGERDPLLVDVGALLGDGGAVVGPEGVRLLLADEIVVRFADDFRLGGAEKALEARVAGEIDAVRVL